ncbi:bifunctional tetrahydrofolate synthase/dihydrofolate synthase [Erwinia sp. OLTSP20]|uniref:bifunctional tetrahydrofolate synthase/dihydrofolate synthase n=1 Tax=unclassified Erwinia TaxID=2622719 RepID=UPI000C173E4F|nr:MULTISPECIES: bifunctional tetrahydrofolate synthase/dihydrofolate synthase [unclassified Erwinia]PIJ51505.1 bifunctional tetrahydrofolate synthase/dihydrofolate synthase [Erwinia sp. OAMSP11]PIJ68603.1 bifunctional tetrahydrofolate synthase/dihydrofolate synthase [Erwinia sp. OLSSP12]PIJ83416.1 bifunctional tetrahydrofolate synthase/dihydrofolate synthase [Erwinia sp. OLCASP19]PIJ86249.1 bifunctional tetrahydrofolate synthase/dihydrofolate synthase [Erwinia sp. OLMTSP26]PIJ88508.1 bifuncti
MDNLQTPEATSPLATWLYYLENLHSQTIELGLTRVRQVAVALDLLKPAPFVFTVAGTNGKGTTCRTLETLLLAAGFRVGVYSSPHLVRYNERVRIQGHELADPAHTEAFAAIEKGRAATSLSYFEYGTLAALWLFRQAMLDVVILEVGLGGRLDATNIIDADVAVITSIALDHTDWLGPDRESIGREKAGIFRAGKPAVVGEPDMPDSIATVAQEKGAQLLCRDRDWWLQQNDNSWTFCHNGAVLDGLPLPQIPLANAATALAALATSGLMVSEAVIRSHIASVVLTGRFQTVQWSPRVILDVAHNPHAARYLAGQIARIMPRGKVHAVVGMLQDKDIAGTLAALAEVVDDWYCAPLPGPRGASAQQLTLHLPQAKNYDSVTIAWRQAMTQASEHDIVLVCGSFHTVADVLETMETEKGRGQ